MNILFFFLPSKNHYIMHTSVQWKEGEARIMSLHYNAGVHFDVVKKQ